MRAAGGVAPGGRRLAGGGATPSTLWRRRWGGFVPHALTASQRRRLSDRAAASNNLPCGDGDGASRRRERRRHCGWWRHALDLVVAAPGGVRPPRVDGVSAMASRRPGGGVEQSPPPLFVRNRGWREAAMPEGGVTQNTGKGGGSVMGEGQETS